MSTRAKDQPDVVNHDDNPTRIVHLGDYPYTHGLCGAKVRGYRHPDSTPVDCVVCAHLAAAGL